MTVRAGVPFKSEDFILVHPFSVKTLIAALAVLVSDSFGSPAHRKYSSCRLFRCLFRAPTFGCDSPFCLSMSRIRFHRECQTSVILPSFFRIVNCGVPPREFGLRV